MHLKHCASANSAISADPGHPPAHCYFLAGACCCGGGAPGCGGIFRRIVLLSPAARALNLTSRSLIMQRFRAFGWSAGGYTPAQVLRLLQALLLRARAGAVVTAYVARSGGDRSSAE